MDTFIFDHVRTPRGRGKAGGSLHEVTPVWLASRPLVALAERNRLDTAAVEEVVMGCVGPVGEQGGNIGRIAVLAADWDQQVPGISIDRACGSGLEAVGFAASKVMAGRPTLRLAPASRACRACRWAVRAAPGRRTRRWPPRPIS